MRAPRLVLAALVACLLPLALLPAAPSLATPSASSLTGLSGSRATPPTGQEDFPQLPAECYDDRSVIVSPCRVTTFRNRPVLVLWGDSHAQMYLPALRRLAVQERVNLVAILFGGCPISTPFPKSAGYPRTGCDKHNVEALRYLRELERRVDKVRLVIGGFWSGYRLAHQMTLEEERTGVPSGLTDYRKHMAALGVKRSQMVFRQVGRLGLEADMIGQAATVPLDPRRCRAGREPYQCDLPRARALNDEAGNERWIRRTLLSHLAGQPRLIDPSPTYCTDVTCFAHVGQLNTFYDDIHLGAALTRTMRRYFRPTLQALLAR